MTLATRAGVRRRVARALPRAPAARLAVLVVAIAVALNVASAVVGAATPEPSGPAGSAYATQPRGVAAWAELLRRSGRRVVLQRQPPAEALPGPEATVVLLESTEPLGREDARALRRFARRGGRLVIGGRDPARWTSGAAGRLPAWRASGAERAATRLGGARTVLTAGEGRWSGLSGARVVAGTARSAAVARAGSTTLVADASALQNRLLDRADNAAFALALAPPGPVVFVESVHGYGEARGLAALPGRWKLALAGLALAGLVFLAGRARRLGPPVTGAQEAAAPPRAAYVRALAERLRLAPEAHATLEPVRAEARRRVAARAALAPDAGEERLLRAARESGIDARPLAAPAVSDEDVLALGRALAATAKTTGREGAT